MLENKVIKPVYGSFYLREERELAKSSLEYITRDIDDIKGNYIKLGFHLYECKKMKYHEDFGYENFYEFCEKNFKLDKSMISRCINVWWEFADKQDSSRMMWLAEEYKEYSFSQLSEMVSLDEKKRRDIKPKMTIKEIRKKKRFWKEERAVATSQPEKCRWDSCYLCEIEDIMKKHFIKRGNIEGCAGCCSGCLNVNKCQYVCQYTQEIEIEKEERKGFVVNECQDESVIVKDIEYKEVNQPELLILKNDNERKAFIENYKKWSGWIDIPETGERYWKYELDNGVKMVVKATLRFAYLGFEKGYAKERSYGSEEYFIFEGDKTAYDAKSSKSALIKYLKDYQKK